MRCSVMPWSCGGRVGKTAHGPGAVRNVCRSPHSRRTLAVVGTLSPAWHHMAGASQRRSCLRPTCTLGGAQQWRQLSACPKSNVRQRRSSVRGTAMRSSSLQVQGPELSSEGEAVRAALPAALLRPSADEAVQVPLFSDNATPSSGASGSRVASATLVSQGDAQGPPAWMGPHLQVLSFLAKGAAWGVVAVGVASWLR